MSTGTGMRNDAEAQLEIFAIVGNPNSTGNVGVEAIIGGGNPRR